MSVNREQIQQINISNFNDLEEGEISDSYINKQDILKLIEENKNKNKISHPDKNTFYQNKNPFESEVKQSHSEIEKEGEKNRKVKDAEEDQEEEDEEPQGFFHKMLKNVENESEPFIARKRGPEVTQGLDKKKNQNKVNTKQKNGPSEKQNTKIIPKKQQQDKKPQNKNLKQKIQTKQKIKQPKQICQFYLNAACHKGNDCTFSHDVPIEKKTELCKYFLTGNCFKGNDCIFSHNTKDFPCKFFHAVGYCDKGDSCKFSHQRLNEDDIKNFVEQNEDFLIEHYKQYGKTNMDDYLNQHIQERTNLSLEELLDKIKVPSTAMIPSNMNQVNLNQIRNPAIIPRVFPNIQKQNMQRPNVPQDNIGNIQPGNLPNLGNMPNFGNYPNLTGQRLPNVAMNMPPRFMPPGINMNPMMLQQQQEMIMKNPMLMQMMRPQLMQNMMRMNMAGKNFVPFNHGINQQMNMNMMHMNGVKSNQILPQKKETNIKEMNVNVSGFIKNINPFDKPQISNNRETISENKSVEFLEKKENIFSDNEEEENEEEEEESKFFLKSVSAGVENYQEMPKVNQENAQNIQNEFSSNKNLELTNILQFVNILKKKNIQEKEEVQIDIPKDPRIKHKKK